MAALGGPSLSSVFVAHLGLGIASLRLTPAANAQNASVTRHHVDVILGREPAPT